MFLLLLLLLLLDAPVTRTSPTPTAPLNSSGDTTAVAACTCVLTMYIIHSAAHAKCIKLHHGVGQRYTLTVYCNIILLMEYSTYTHCVSHKFMHNHATHTAANKVYIIVKCFNTT